MNNLLKKKSLLLGGIFILLGITATQVYGYLKYKTFPSSLPLLISGFPENSFLHKTLRDNYEFSDTVVFSPDSLYLARSDGNKVTIWEVNSGKEHKTFSFSNDDNSSPSIFSRNGQYIANSLFSRNGQYIANVVEDKINIWEISNGRLQEVISNNAKSANSMTLSHDGKYLAIGGGDGKIAIFDVNSGQLQQSFTHENPVKNLVFSPNNQYLASADSKGVKVWNLSSGKLERTFLGDSLNILFSPDNRYLAMTIKSPSSNTTVKIWDINNGELQHSFPHFVDFSYKVINIMTFSPDGRYLVNTIEDPIDADTEDAHLSKSLITVFWDINTGEFRNTKYPSKGEFDLSSSKGELAFSSDGRYLAVGKSNAYWGAWRQGSYPSDAFASPTFDLSERNGRQTYICIAGGTIGKLIVDHKKCLVGHAGKEIDYDQYLVLYGLPHDYQWVRYTRKIPSSTIYYGTGEKKGSIYVCAARHKGSWIPGTFVPSKKSCYIVYGGKEHRYKKFYILIRR